MKKFNDIDANETQAWLNFVMLGGNITIAFNSFQDIVGCQTVDTSLVMIGVNNLTSTTD